MKKRFDFDMGLDDDDVDLDNDLSKQIDKIEIKGGQKKRGHGRTDSVVSAVQDGPYTGAEPQSTRESLVSMIQTSVKEEPSMMHKPPQQQLTSAQLASKKLQQQNKMSLKIGAPAADGAEDCEVYGGE